MKKLAYLSALLVAFTVGAAAAEEKPEVVVDGLTNPCGLAVQPETGDVFVADSGAGRVVRIRDGKIEDAITGFAKDIYGKGPMYDIGPLGLAFLDKETLVVGGGDHVDGEEMMWVFTVPEAGKSITVADAKQSLGPITETPELKPEGNFYGVAITDRAIYTSSNGDDTKGWVLRAEIKGTKIGPLERFLATKEAVNVDAPVGICISPKGDLVVGQMGEINVPNDALLTFYNARNGKMILNLPTGLYDITALAYSPKGHLYALDFAWMATEEGGLFRLDATRKGGKQELKAVKIAGLDKPTALAFGPDGTMYITVIGTAAEGSDKPAGKLLKLAPGL